MKVIDKIIKKNNDIYGAKPVTIAFLGDSVTQGCFEVYTKLDGSVETVFDSEHAFSSKLKRIINFLYPSAQINIINSGISGDNAVNGNLRFDRDVAPFNPDLVVVGFGLNDCMQGDDGKTRYRDALDGIFKKVKAINAECILLTPNLMNDSVSPHITDQNIKDLAVGFMQNNLLDDYVSVALGVAMANDLKVCDVYSKWKLLKENGVNTTELLANKLNHPLREMGWLTAVSLMETILN